MAETNSPLIIKRYASRRLYNTETSDYVTLDAIAGFIRDGREVKVVDLKSGDDLTRQYLLQIIAEHENRGHNVLPISVLNDLVRSYTNQAQSIVPQFLAMSFEMLRDGQSKIMESMGAMNPMNPMAGVPGFKAMRAQQEAFLKAVSGGWSAPVDSDGNVAPVPETEEAEPDKDAVADADPDAGEIEAMKLQIAAMADRIERMEKG